MADRTVDILIAIDSRLKGLEEAQKGLEKVTKQSTSAGEALKTGFSIDIASRVVDGLSRISAAVKEVLVDGVQFNATLQDARIGIAAVLRQFDQTGKYKTFADALRSSAGAIDLLKAKALQSPATFEQLVGAFQGLSGSFASAGIDLERQVELVVLMSQALNGLGIRSEQILQESRALVTGNITEDAAAAKILQITKEQIDQARESGQLFEFLQKRLGAFAEASAEGAKGWNTQLSNLEDSLTQLKGLATAGIFEPLTNDLAALNQVLGDPRTAEAVAAWGNSLALTFTTIQDAVSSVKETVGTGWMRSAFDVAVKIAPGGFVAESAMKLQDAGRLQAMQDRQLKEANALTQQLKAATTLEQKKKAVEKIEASITEWTQRRSEMSERELTQTDSQIRFLESLVRNQDRLAGSKKKEGDNTKAAAEAQKKAEESVEKALGSQLRLMHAKATGNSELIRQAEQQARLSEIVAKFDKSSAEEKRVAARYAAQILEAERAIVEMQLREETALIRQQVAERGANPKQLVQLKQDNLDKVRSDAVTELRGKGVQISDTPTVDELRFANAGFLSSADENVFAKLIDQVSTAEQELEQARVQASAQEERVAGFRREAIRNREAEKDILDETVSAAEHQAAVEEELARLRSTYAQELKGGIITEQQLSARAEENVRLAERRKTAQEGARDAVREERDLLQEINRQIGAVNGNPFLTRAEKNEAVRPLLGQQRNLLMERQTQGQNVDAELQDNESQTRLTTPGGELQAEWTSWLDSLGTTAQNTGELITGSLTTALQGVSQALTGVITGTATWGQVGLQVLSGLISEVINYTVQQVAMYAIINPLRKAFHVEGETMKKTEMTSTVQKNTTEAASATSNALAQSLASWGISAVVGAAAFAAAMALAGGFAEGGYTGAGGKYEPAGIVHRGEFVLNQRATNHYGPALLDRMNRMEMPMSRGYAEGGPVDVGRFASGGLSGGGAGGRPVQVHVVFDESDMRKRMLNHPEAEHQIIRTGRRRSAEMGVRRG